MQILIIGAGVIGSIMAARLGAAGHSITVLERGKRLEQLTGGGTIVIRDGITGQITNSPVRLTADLNGIDTVYDYVLVSVRASQLQALLPAMAASRAMANIVVMVNSMEPARAYTQLKDKMLLGFPGMGGGFEGSTVVYQLAHSWLQKTSFGEVNGSITPRVGNLVKAFQEAGIPAAAQTNMVAWQQTHVGWVVPLAAALYGAGTSKDELARRPELIEKAILAIRETLTALERQKIPITPGKFKWVKRLPIRLQLPAWQQLLAHPGMEYLAVRHCKAAPEEMRLLADELKDFLTQAGTDAADYLDLMEYIPTTTPS